MHSQLSQIATLTSNLGQQNRGINRVAKTPSLIPPTKMHAFKAFLVCENTDFVFSERDNAEMTTCSILVHPRSFTIQQYNQKCSLNYILQLFQGTFYREAQYKKTQAYNGIKKHPTNTEDSCHHVPSVLSIWDQFLVWRSKNSHFCMKTCSEILITTSFSYTC